MFRRLYPLRRLPVSQPNFFTRLTAAGAQPCGYYGTSPVSNQQMSPKKRSSIYWEPSSSSSPRREAPDSMEPSPRVVQEDSWTTRNVNEFNISSDTEKRLAKAGITSLFPVQSTTYQKAMQQQDIVVRAKTGSGKTLGFAIPIIENLKASGRMKLPRAIVLAPTRELAKQVETEFARIAGPLRTISIYGGTPYEPQRRALKDGVDVVVGTPGRVHDLLINGHLKLDKIQHAVLDEADDMLQMGFREEVEKIYGYLPQPVNLSGSLGKRDSDRAASRVHHMLWSATVPQWIERLAKTFLHKPEFVDLVGSSSPSIPSTVQHGAVIVDEGKHSRPSDGEVSPRQAVLASILEEYADKGRVLVFTETKAEATSLTRLPTSASIVIESLTGDLSQQVRERTLQGFKKGSINVICATDVAARGLDIPSVDAVVHYRIPRQTESFVHRTGRTGRAGNSGINLCIFSPSERREVASLSKHLGFAWKYVSPDSLAELRGNSNTTDSRIQSTLNGLEEAVRYPPKTSKHQGLVTQFAEKLIDASQGSAQTALERLIALRIEKASKTSMDLSLLTGSPGHVTLIYQPPLSGETRNSSFHPELSPRKAKRVVAELLQDVGASRYTLNESKMVFYSGQQENNDSNSLLPRAHPGVVFDLPSNLANSVIQQSGGTISKVKQLPQGVAKSLLRPTRQEVAPKSKSANFHSGRHSEFSRKTHRSGSREYRR
eukprot:gb/GECG01014537.1/.p1 GENE.gb/GECG01014537.1/~~gb/GECG01014537.1/.p1  ORF type:complete len:716 (+),score=75.28 gb/GECG01014537.1/:1-2148(+)